MKKIVTRNVMLSLSNLLAAVPLGTGSFFFHSHSRERISATPPPMFVKFKLNIPEHFRDILGRNVYGRNTAKLDNLDVWPLSIENEALLKCNFAS